MSDRFIRLTVDTGPPVQATEYPVAQPIVDAENHVAGSATDMSIEQFAGHVPDQGVS